MSAQKVSLDELDELIDRVGDELFAYLTALTRDPERAADLLQSVFVRFIEQVGRGRIERRTAEHYLKRMCRNAFIDLTRADKRTAALPEGFEIPEPEREKKIRADSHRVRIVLTEALSDPELEPVVQTVLRLRLLEELDVGSICEQTGSSRSTVQRLMRKGVAFLAERFREADLTLADIE